jgi:hypothetical protein
VALRCPLTARNRRAVMEWDSIHQPANPRARQLRCTLNHYTDSRVAAIGAAANEKIKKTCPGPCFLGAAMLLSRYSFSSQPSHNILVEPPARSTTGSVS